MAIRKRVKGFLKALSSPRSTSGSDAVDLADTHASQGSQEGVDVEVLLNTNGSTTDQASTNETIKQSESPRNVVAPLKLENIPIRELWNVAYEKLREEEGALIADYEAKLRGSVVAGLGETLRQTTNIRERMWAILQSKMDEVNNNTMKLKLGSAEVKIKDAAQLVLGVVGSANDYITQAVSANPYASIAWAGVSFLLPLFMNISSQSASLAEGLEYISSLISQSQMREEIYIRRYESQLGCPKEFRQSHREYKAALERLYRQILRFQAKSCCYYSNSSASRHGLDAVKWNGWDQLVNDVRKRDEEFAAVEQIWRDIQRLEKRLADESAISQKEREELLDWLCNVDPSSLYNTARERHESGTNEWLVKDSREFKAWETSAGSLLWLHGKAGSGKSVLSSSVISYLKGQYASKPLTALAYFYFSFSDVEKQKTDVMIASLIKQICSPRPDVPDVHHLADYKVKKERPDTETLEATLKACIARLSAVYLVIDGLDECPLLGGQRNKLLKSLRRILSSSHDNLHVFLTSRKEPDIDLGLRDLLSPLLETTTLRKSEADPEMSDLLDPPSRIEIDLITHQKILNKDIGRYVELTLATNEFKSWPPAVKEEARQSLLEKADCMFQYVRFQLEMLQEVSSESEIRRALQNLPVGLDATYNRIFENINIKFRARIMNSLKWLAFSRRLLTTEELSEIFIIDPDSTAGFNEGARLFSPSDIFKYFSGLIIAEENDDFGHTVRLTHFSLKEYLTSDRIREGPVSTFSFTELDAHIYIVRSSLAYLAYISTKNGKSQDYPLASYVTISWALHFEEIPRESRPAQMAQYAALALANNSQSLLIQIFSRDFYNNREPFSISDMDQLTKPHCYAVQHGYRQLTEVMVSPEASSYQYLTQEDLDCGLRCATYGDNMDIVRFFLKAGANINASSGLYAESAVDAAVDAQNYKVLELLASYGADTGHLSASKNWNSESLKLLLALGADINGQDHRDWGTALHEALKYGNLEIVDLLLERGADVNALSESLGTPLQAACTMVMSSGFDSFSRIETLLNRGADPNLRGGEYATALQAACFTGLRKEDDDIQCVNVMEVVQLLIKRGADVNLAGGEYGTALAAAAAASLPGAVEVMKLLISNGAEIHQRGGDNWETALQAACHKGTIEAVRFLLDHGADVNAEGGLRFGTPLQAASARWSWGVTARLSSETKIQILQMLIDRGAKIDHRGGNWGTALQAACIYPDLEVLRFLFEHGADANAEGGEHGTALIAACQARQRDGKHVEHAECVQLLLDRGAEVNAKGEEHGTALMAVCGRQFDPNSVENDKRVVRLLLDRGADINAQSGRHGTALSAACRGGHSALVQLLLSRGADFHLQDCAAWHAAVSINDNADMLRLLLDHGMDVNHLHEEHGTALHVMMGRDADASQDGDWRKGIDVLFEHGIDPSIMHTTRGSALHVACAVRHSVLHFRDRKKCSGCTNTNNASEKTECLLQRYPDIDANARGGIFDSALQAAAYSGQTLSVRHLLDRKADVNMRGGKYGSALNGAIVGGYWNIVEILLHAGATPDCHLREHPDEEWLRTVLNEDGRGAVERYRKFWDVQIEKKKEAQTHNSIS